MKDLNDLNKNQIVLLTLLVSFMTSIATGIVTVTLMDQAPPGVTQTVNRVVERTIERVVPGESKTSTVIKEVPVLISEEQIISDLVQSASPGVVTVANDKGQNLGSGFIMSKDGQVVTATHILGDTPSRDQKFIVVLKGGQKIQAQLTKFSLDSDIAILQASLPPATNSSASSTPVWVPLELTDTETFPGQTLVALGASQQGSITVSGGIVSSLVTSATSSAIIFINTNAVTGTNVGGPVFNTKGKVIGISSRSSLAVEAGSINDLIKQQ